MNTHSEEDRNYQPEDVMDIDEGAFPRRGKAKAMELEEQEGPAQCGAYTEHGSS